MGSICNEYLSISMTYGYFHQLLGLKSTALGSLPGAFPVFYRSIFLSGEPSSLAPPDSGDGMTLSVQLDHSVVGAVVLGTAELENVVGK